MKESEVKLDRLCDRLAWARKACNLNQDVAAKKVGITQSSLSDLESGKSKTSRHTAQLAALYGINGNWLATGKGSRHAIVDDIFKKYLGLNEVDQKIVADLIRSLSARNSTSNR